MRWFTLLRMSGSVPTYSNVREAAERIRPYAHRTPVMTCSALDELAGRRLFFKCEQFQKVGAFKFRGACNAVMKLSVGDASRGVVTHSSGNHGQAVALAAKWRGISAHVVMPTNTVAVKLAAVRGYGARIVECAPGLAAREAMVEQVMAQTGAILIPPYNHSDVIAGQGTVALELLDQVGDLDAIVAPVGGGGLISGICIAAKAINPGIRIFAGEPEGADDAFQSKQRGERINVVSAGTIADGLRTGLGSMTWPFVRDEVESVIRVSDDETVSAMRLVWERMKLLVEPSGAVAVAVAVAAILSNGFLGLGGIHRVGVVLSGGNVDLDRLPWLSEPGGNSA